MKLPDSLKKLVDFFESFPEIGPRQALRLTFFVARNEKFKSIFKNISEEIQKIKLCKDCYFPFENEGDLCFFCSNPQRDKRKLCIVLSETTVLSLEKAQFYDGVYFILGERELEKNIEKLRELIKQRNVQKIIFSLPLTSEGRVIVEDIKSGLSDFKVEFIEPKMGLPKGGEVEFADPETLKEAFKF